MFDQRYFHAKSLSRAVAGVFCLGLLSGCAAMSGYPTDPQNLHATQDSNDLKTLREKYFDPAVDECYREAGSTKSQPCLGLTDKQAIRNDVVLNRMRVYDMEFSLFARDLSSTNNSISIGSDLTALALNGLGATTGDTATKAALAAASGGVIAANGAVDKDLFYQKTIPALISQMQADRLAAESTILQGLKNSDVDYPLQRAELDLDTLNDAGSLNSAIAAITQNASTQQSDNQATMNQTSVMAYTPSAVTILTWLKNGGTFDAARNGQLQSWLTNNTDQTLRAKHVSDLIGSDAGMEAARQLAIKQLSITN